jgi:hypothetical protein
MTPRDADADAQEDKGIEPVAMGEPHDRVHALKVLQRPAIASSPRAEDRVSERN